MCGRGKEGKRGGSKGKGGGRCKGKVEGGRGTSIRGGGARKKGN